VTRAAGPHTHLALPTSSARPLACHSNGLLQLLTAMPQLHGMCRTAADILARWLVLITGVSATPTWALILPPTNDCSTGTRMPGYPLTALWINSPTFDTDHRHWHRGGMFTKTPPPTELQIPATVTTLLTISALVCEDIARQSYAMVPRWRFLATFASCISSEPRAAHFRPAF